MPRIRTRALAVIAASTSALLLAASPAGACDGFVGEDGGSVAA